MVWVHPTCVYCRWHCSLFFLRFAINLNIEPGWVYGLGCSFFLKVEYKFKDKKLSNTVEFMVRVSVFFFNVEYKLKKKYIEPNWVLSLDHMFN
jgi:hypothetical protein